MVGEVLDAEQAAWVAHHHERWDGLGYPAGLVAEAIPEGARVLALADAWDAMTWASLNRIPMSEPEALRECRAASGGQFWPEAVAALERLTTLGGLSPSPGPWGRPAPDRPL
jgi:HD-GYP domain-containing protein (c-di-GMP phosphodiesterase class II)